MKTHEAPHARARRMVTGAGYHPDEKQDEALIKTMVKKRALKNKRGGSVEGEAAQERPDKRARGGRLKAPKIGGVHVNVMHSDPAAEQMARQQGMQQGVKVGAQLGARQAMAAGAHPPGAGGPPPGAGGPPPGGMAGPPGGPPPMAGPMGPRPPMGAPGPQMAAHGGEIKKRRGGGSACE